MLGSDPRDDDLVRVLLRGGELAFRFLVAEARLAFKRPWQRH